MSMRAAVLLLIAATFAACAPPRPSPTLVPSYSPGPSASLVASLTGAPTQSAGPSPVPSPTPTASQAVEACVPPTAVGSPAYAGDPCPLVLAAFRRAVADIAFPVGRISVVPGA